MKKYLLTLSLLLLPTIVFAQAPEVYNLKLKGDDINKIGKALGKLPFEEVADLLLSLRQQAAQQEAIARAATNKPVDTPSEETKKNE